jgi:photosystem II stability/assembly factor-like uncharacterized protein
MGHHRESPAFPLRGIVLAFAVTVLVAMPASAEIQGTNWFPIGPAPIDGFFSGGVSGRASAIGVNPSNPDDIWLGTATGGVWHSIDGGLNWEPESDKEDALAVGSIALDGCSATGCTSIYAGTGENAIRRDTYYGAGLMIGGSTGGEFPQFVWTQRTGTPFDFRFGSINDVVLDPTTSGASKRVFVTLSTGVTVAAPESTLTAPVPTAGAGIYRSDDQGVSWSKLTVSGADPALPTDLEMRPDDSNTLFAGFLGRGVFRSTDGGNTWCPLNNGIPKPGGCPNQQLPDIGTSVFDHVEIAIAPSNPQVVYAAFGRCADRLLQNCRPTVWRSQNGGQSWTEKNAGDPNDPGDGNAHGYSRYTHALAVDPTDENRLLLGGVNLWRSTDGGATFVTSDTNLAPGGGVVHSDHHEVVFHPTSAGRAYSTGDGGFATSTNGGASWTPRNDDLQITGFQGIGSSPLTGAVIGTSQDNGGQLWNGSRRWTWRGCCGDGGYSFLDFDDAMTMYAGTNFGSLMRSTNGGANWGGISSGAWNADPRLFYAPFVQDPSASGGNHPIYFGSNRLWRSTNDGGSWTDVSPVLATGSFPEIVTTNSVAAQVANPTGGQNVITAIAVAPSDPNRVYVGYYGGQVFRTTGPPCNTAACWTAIESGLPDAPITRIAVHPTQPNTAYVTISGFGNFARVWKTTNGGTVWSPAAAGLPAGIPANTVSIEPSQPERVYLGLDSGPGGASLYRSTDGGGSWAAFADGLPNAPVYEISVDETHGRAYAATHGRGVFVLGKPFLSNFEGWVNDSIWDIPVYGQNFLPNQTCTLQVLQSNGDVCASGTVDVKGGTIDTDGGGVLETNLAGMWNGKKVVWACFNGKCVGNTPIANCYDDADGDGDPDPLSSIVVACGGQIATATVVGCPPLDNPPSSFAELDLSGLDQGGGGGGPAAGEARAAGVLRLSASVQRRVGTASLCTVAVPYFVGETEETVLARVRDALLASSTCAANKVRAELDSGKPGPSEDEFARPPRLRLTAPGVVGGQLITAVHVDPGSGTGSCVRVKGLGVPVLNQIQILKIDLITPPEGAAGGRIRLVEETPIGPCALTIPTTPGQHKAALAAAVAAAVDAPGIPGPHPECPSEYNARDIANHGGSLVTVYASGLELCTTDPKVGFDIRSEELANVHPVADAGKDRVLPGGSPVLMSGGLSSDPDSTPGTHDDIAHFEWFDVTSGPPVLLGSTESLNVPLAPGLHRLRLRVTDRGGLSDTDDVLVSVESGGLGRGRFLASFHVGSTSPLGNLSDTSDSNVHVRADVGYAVTDRLRLLLFGGLSQLTGETAAGIPHPRWFNASANGQFLFPLPSGTAFYVSGGPGIYWAKGGGSDPGFNVGFGFQLPIRASYRIELGADFHRIQDAHARFLTLQLGVLFR